MLIFRYATNMVAGQAIFLRISGIQPGVTIELVESGVPGRGPEGTGTILQDSADPIVTFTKGVIEIAGKTDELLPLSIIQVGTAAACPKPQPAGAAFMD